MKAAARPIRKHRSDFYTSSLAPVNQQHETPFRLADAALLSVLILEIMTLVHRFLAK
jgi:hypothetical protein